MIEDIGVNMKPLVSIVIPVYKVDYSLLDACVNSCIGQTEKNIEIILVNDCSPDHCGDLCDKYARLDSRIKVIHKEKNGGLSAARNTGVYESTGEWIMFLDGDDWIEKNTCEQIRDINDPELEMVFFGMIRDYENQSENFEFTYPDKCVYDKNGCKQLQIDVLDYSKRIATAYAKFVRNDFIKKYKIYHDEDVRQGIEGIEYNLRLFGYLHKAMSINKHLYHYVYNLDSITGVPSHKSNGFILLGLEKMKAYISQGCHQEVLYEQFERRVHRVINDVAVGCYFNPNYKLKYKERKTLFSMFCDNTVIKDALKKNSSEKSIVKKITYYCVKYRIYFVLYFLGVLRIKVLNSR